MKGSFVIMFVMIVCVAVVFLTNCATVGKKVPAPLEEALTEPKVEVLEVKVEKVTWISQVWGEKVYGVNITGKAIYHPAKVGGKSFVEATKGKEFYFDFYDSQGLKLPLQVSFNAQEGKCGPNGMPENVVPGEPFTFEKRAGIASEDEPDRIALWERIATTKFVKWE